MAHDELDIGIFDGRFIEGHGMTVLQEGVGRSRQARMDGDGLVILPGQLVNGVIELIVDVDVVIARIELDAAALLALEVLFDLGRHEVHIVIKDVAVQADAVAHVIGIVMTGRVQGLVAHDDAVDDIVVLKGLVQAFFRIGIACSQGDLVEADVVTEMKVTVNDP